METGKLYARIAIVSKEVGSLLPDKKNLEQRYDYISADKILERAGDAMAKHGLVVIPSIVGSDVKVVTYTKTYSGKVEEKWRLDAEIYFEMTVADSDGNAITQKWVGRGSDYSTPDKALYKAITSGHKYFLMKLFNVGIGNEDGEHEVQDTDYTPVQPKRQASHVPMPKTLPEAREFLQNTANPTTGLVADLVAGCTESTQQVLMAMINELEMVKAADKTLFSSTQLKSETALKMFDCLVQESE